MKEKDNKKKFQRFVLLILFSIVAFIIVMAFLFDYNIENNIIILTLILVVLALSETFDNFAIGKLFTMKRNVKEIEAEKQIVIAENFDLKDKLFSITNTMLNNQTNINLNGPITPEIAKLLRPEKASEEEIKDKEKLETSEERLDETEPKARKAIRGSDVEAKTYEILRKRSIQIFGDSSELIEQVKLSVAFSNIDPISNHVPIFDGYVTNDNGEHFIEIKYLNSRFYSSFWYDRVYVMINKVMMYSRVKKINAKLYLVLRYNKDDDSNRQLNRIHEYFGPAIKNGSLEIVPIQIEEGEFE